MNTFFIEYLNNKFINNLQILKTQNKNILTGDISNNLYEIFYKYNFNEILFLANKLDSEKYQFISEYKNSVKCYIYHENEFDNLLYQKLSDIKHLINKSEQDKINKNIENIIVIPSMINTQVYYTDHTINKVPIISCFIDQIKHIPKNLETFLYPNTKLPIKLFNNPNIIHHQNLGTLSEIDKSTILRQSEYYLSIDEYYLEEAIACDCKVLTIDELDDLKPKKYTKIKKNNLTYTNFIENL